MKTFLHLIVMLIFLSLFFACKTSSRLSSSSETNRKADIQLAQHATSAASTAAAIVTNKNIALDITEETTFYDASKPNIAGTDHPPALKTTIKHIKIADNSTINKQTVSENKATSDSQLKLQAKESTKEKVTKTSKTLLSLPWWIYPAVIVLILAALYFFCPPIHILINKLFAYIKGLRK